MQGKYPTHWTIVLAPRLRPCIQLPVGGLLGGFCNLAIVNNISMNMGMYLYFQISIFVFFSTQVGFQSCVKFLPSISMGDARDQARVSHMQTEHFAADVHLWFLIFIVLFIWCWELSSEP